MHKSLTFLALLGMGLAGCAAMPEGVGPIGEEREQVAAPRAEDPRAQLMYHVLVGEMAGQLGDLHQSVESYLQAARDSNDPRIAERAARIASYANLPEQGLEAAQRWVALAPDSLDAQQMVGVLYVRNGRPEAALPHFDKVIEATREMHGGGYLLVGALLSRDTDPEPALQAMEMLVARNPEEAEAHFALANLALQAGEYERAGASARRALALDPSLVEARVVEARALFGQGEEGAAVEQMRTLVREYPRNDDLRLTLARMLVQAKRYDEALEQFAKVIEHRPGDGDLLYTAALVSLELDRYDQAEEYLLRVLDTGRHISEARYYLGRIAEERGEYKMAISWYIKVVEGQHTLDAQARIAGMLAKLGRLDKAREHLRQLREQAQEEATRVRLYLVEGQLLREADEYQAAMDLYDGALQLYPDDPDLLYARALTAERLDRLDLLEADLRSILERDPDNASALNALGYTLVDRTDRYQEGRGYIERAYELRPDDPAIIDSMGWLHFRLGDYAAAERYLRRAYEAFPDPEVAAHLVETLWAQGKRQEARRLFEAAHTSAPEDRRLNALKRRLGL